MALSTGAGVADSGSDRDAGLSTGSGAAPFDEDLDSKGGSGPDAHRRR
jgi:hypothetical protein